MPDPASNASDPTRVLFVCLGNICRSPLAEAVFRHESHTAPAGSRFEVESAGTGAWHVGEPPDPRAVKAAARRGIEVSGRARAVRESDFTDFDLIVAMDRENLRELRRRQDSLRSSARLVLLRDFDPEPEAGRDVPDPYYGGSEGFEQVLDIVIRSCRVLLLKLAEDQRPETRA